jgi:nucleoid DNA-binding protein
MTTVTRADLAEAARLGYGVLRNDARDLVDQCLGMISDALVAGDRVGINGFGSFNVRQRPDRTGRNPKQPDDEIVIPARRVVTFRASRKVLKEAVNRGVRGGPERQSAQRHHR